MKRRYGYLRICIFGFTAPNIQQPSTEKQLSFTSAQPAVSFHSDSAAGDREG